MSAVAAISAISAIPPSAISASAISGTPLFADLSGAADGVRVSIHVLAATIWVGGQFTVAGLVPTAKQLGADAPKKIANAFARIMWPAYAVLLVTGFWNVAAVGKGQPSSWNVVL